MACLQLKLLTDRRSITTYLRLQKKAGISEGESIFSGPLNSDTKKTFPLVWLQAERPGQDLLIALLQSIRSFLCRNITLRENYASERPTTMATSPESTSSQKRSILNFTSPKPPSSSAASTPTPREQTPDRSNSTPPVSRLRAGAGGFRALARGIMKMQSLASGTAALRLATRRDSFTSILSVSLPYCDRHATCRGAVLCLCQPGPRRRLSTSSMGLMKGRLAAVARGVMQVHTMTNIARSLGGGGPPQPRASSRRGSVDSTRSRRSSIGGSLGRKDGKRSPKRLGCRLPPLSAGRFGAASHHFSRPDTGHFPPCPRQVFCDGKPRIPDRAFRQEQSQFNARENNIATVSDVAQIKTIPTTS
ncbi:hypothetical protein Bbelb_134080 [Branchiostoma belcheri]|nr:hypothetical protein Bbelb_134080 [Branchiostoma belcheri]